MKNNDEDLTCYAENKRKRKKISSSCDSSFNNLNSNSLVPRKELPVEDISATNKSVDIRYLSKDNTINLCRLVVNTIKTIIGIDNDNFDKYRNHIEKKGIDNKVVLRHLLSKETILELSEKVKDLRIHKYKLQIERCLQVIAPLFITCSNYKCLKNFLKVKTTLEDKQIRNTIKKYVSLLERLNPEFNVRKWLPRETILQYTYEITKNLVEELGLEKTGIKGILLKPDNREKFEELAKYHFNSEIPIIVKCCSCGKIWTTNPRAIKRKWWCGECEYANKRLKKEDLKQIEDQTNLKLISEYEEYKELLTTLKWQCLKCKHEFRDCTSNIRRYTYPCPNCRKEFYKKRVLKEFNPNPFKWNTSNWSTIGNSNLKRILGSFLSDIQNYNFPVELFINPNYNMSQFELKGDFKDGIRFEVINNYFDNHLLKEIKSDNPLYEICVGIKNVYGKISSLGYDTHPLIQDYFLSKSSKYFTNINPIASEVPVWGRYDDDFITGYIDLLISYNNTLIIFDIKPEGKKEVFRKIPQLLGYALYLIKRLEEYDEINFEIKCIGASRDYAWVFDPLEVREKLLDFFQFEKKKSNRINDPSMKKKIEKLVAFLG